MNSILGHEGGGVSGAGVFSRQQASAVQSMGCRLVGGGIRGLWGAGGSALG
jgi:hypothetical protein